MASFPFQLWSNLPRITVSVVLDILVVAILIYQFIAIVRGRRAGNILTGILILVGVYVVSVWLDLELLRWSLATLAPYTIFALIVMFQSDIRRMLARIGRRRFAAFGSRVKTTESTDDILQALTRLSQTRTGALIVVERDIGLRTFVESGVALDALISRDLLLAIFEKDSALHDGAIILQGDRISAAACFLPLSMNPALLSTHGTRHRAGIGVTEETDCLAVVVSEETGSISVAAFGEVEQHLTLEQVRDRLHRHFGERGAGGRARPSSEALRAASRGLSGGE